MFIRQVFNRSRVVVNSRPSYARCLASSADSGINFAKAFKDLDMRTDSRSDGKQSEEQFNKTRRLKKGLDTLRAQKAFPDKNVKHIGVPPRRLKRATINLRDEIADFFWSAKVDDLKEAVNEATRGSFWTIEIKRVDFSSDLRHCDVYWQMPHSGKKYWPNQLRWIERKVEKTLNPLKLFLTDRLSSRKVISVRFKRVLFDYEQSKKSQEAAKGT